MIHAQNTKYVQVIAPQAVLKNASWTVIEIDTKDYDYCEVPVTLGATDVALTVLKMQESDVSGSGQVDVPGLIYGTSATIAGTTSALPTATDDNKTFAFDIDCRGRKRYLTLVATADDGTTGAYLCALAQLSRATISPVSAADRKLAAVLRV
jgi:hypothetical protein